MDVMIMENGVRQKCDTAGCMNPAMTVYSTGVIAGGYSAGQKKACDEHNPWSTAAVPLPVSFTSTSLCHACGQPVNAGSFIATTPAWP